MVGVIIASMVGMGIQEETRGMAKPTLLFLLLFTATGKLFSFVQFIGFFGPLIGIFLGFDSINRERVSRTLSKLVSQPIYRDSIINAKFLAGVTIIAIVLVAIVLLISGLGIRLIGVVPGPEEIWRLAIYVVISLLYISFWLGISILFSVVFRSTATSALASLAIWIFFSFFVSLGAGFMADAVAPISQSGGNVDPDVIIKHEEISKTVSLFSPMTLYSEATNTILDPTRKDDPVHDPHGSSGKALPLPIPESSSPVAEHHYRDSPSDLDCGHYVSNVRHLLSGLYAPGDQDGLGRGIAKFQAPITK